MMANDFKVTVSFDGSAVKARVEAAKDQGIAVITNEALKDANFFAREDSGELIRSSLRASQPDSGLLIWDEPYAKKMYYIGTPVKDVNPNASLMWAHKGHSANKAKYLDMAKKIAKLVI